MPPLADKPDEVASAILDAAAARPDKPVLASFLGGAGVADLLHRGDLVVPTYTFPEAAATSLGHAAAYQTWRSTPAGVVPDLTGVDAERARALIASSAPGPVPAAVAAELLASYGIAVRGVNRAPDPTRFSPSAPTRSSDRWSPSVSPGTTPISWRTSPTASPPQRPRRPRDGPLAAGRPLLDGRTGGPRVDLAALEETLLRISAMVEDHTEIEALELRPVRLLRPGDGVAVAHATIRLADNTATGGSS